MTAISEALSDERLERVLTSLPPNDRPDGYPRQTQVQVAWLRTVLTELLALRSGNGGEVRGPSEDLLECVKLLLAYMSDGESPPSSLINSIENVIAHAEGRS